MSCLRCSPCNAGCMGVPTAQAMSSAPGNRSWVPHLGMVSIACWLQVILRMSKELPLVVEYRIQDMGNLSFYLVRIVVHACAPPCCWCSTDGAIVRMNVVRVSLGDAAQAPKLSEEDEEMDS